jgi:two-component system NarL family sensor kinase
VTVNVLRRGVPAAVQLANAHERKRLCRDLHDGLGPSLATASMRLDLVRSLMETDPAAASTQLAQVHTDVLGAIADVRRLIYNLRPPALDGVSLPAALGTLATRFEEASRQRLRIRVELAAPLPPLVPSMELAAFLIASEAMTNVARHARAGTCSVQVVVVGRCLHLRVQDDGVGIPPDHRPGLGTLSMRQRTVELGGRCTIARRSPRGTVVWARLPLDGPAGRAGE